MKKLIVFLVIGSLMPSVFASLDFNDGGNNIIDYVVIDSSVLIDNDNLQSSPENYTFVELVDGGQIDSVYTYGYSQLVISGGVVNAGILARGNSHIIMNGGTYMGEYSDRNIYDDALLEVFGGDFAHLWFASFGGEIKIYGYDFTVTEEAYGHGELLYTFNGTLANGEIVSDLKVTGLPEDISLIEVPEPATLGLLALGGVLLRRRRAA